MIEGLTCRILMAKKPAVGALCHLFDSYSWRGRLSPMGSQHHRQKAGRAGGSISAFSSCFDYTRLAPVSNSCTVQTWSVNPAAFAGVVLMVEWTRQKL